MLEKIRNLTQFFNYPSHGRTISVLAILIILAVVPLTVFIGSQQQEIRQHASGEPSGTINCENNSCSCNGSTCATTRSDNGVSITASWQNFGQCGDNGVQSPCSYVGADICYQTNDGTPPVLWESKGNGGGASVFPNGSTDHTQSDGVGQGQSHTFSLFEDGYTCTTDDCLKNTEYKTRACKGRLITSKTIQNTGGGSTGAPSCAVTFSDVPTTVNAGSSFTAKITQGVTNVDWGYVSLYLDGTKVPGGAVVGGNSYNFVVPAGSAGSHTLTFKTHDYAGYGVTPGANPNVACTPSATFTTEGSSGIVITPTSSSVLPQSQSWQIPTCNNNVFSGCANAGATMCSDNTGLGASTVAGANAGTKAAMTTQCKNTCGRFDKNTQCNSVGSPTGTVTGPTIATPGQELTYTFDMQGAWYTYVYAIVPPSNLTGSSLNNWWLGLSETTNNNTNGSVTTIVNQACPNYYCNFIVKWKPPQEGTYYISMSTGNLGGYACAGNLGMHHGKNSANIDPNFWKVCNAETTDNGYGDLIKLTVAPTLSPTPTTPSAGSSSLSLDLKLGAIGGAGENHNPKTPNRQISVQAFNSFTDQPVGDPKTGQVTYQSTTGRFTGIVNVGALQPGNYYFKIKTDRYLKKKTSLITVTANKTSYDIPQLALAPGDINGDNKIDILDYNTIVNCFVNNDGTTPSTCGNDKLNADLDDNGVVDGVDYNIFIANLSTKEGE